MKKALSVALLSLMFALTLPTLALADIAPPQVLTPRGYTPLVIVTAAVVAVVVIIAMMRKARKNAKAPVGDKREEDK